MGYIESGYVQMSVIAGWWQGGTEFASAARFLFSSESPSETYFVIIRNTTVNVLYNLFTVKAFKKNDSSDNQIIHASVTGIVWNEEWKNEPPAHLNQINVAHGDDTETPDFFRNTCTGSQMFGSIANFYVDKNVLTIPTNIPIFDATDCENQTKYHSTGDYSGAINGEELNFPNIDFHVYCEDYGQPVYVKWDIINDNDSLKKVKLVVREIVSNNEAENVREYVKEKNSSLSFGVPVAPLLGYVSYIINCSTVENNDGSNVEGSVQLNSTLTGGNLTGNVGIARSLNGKNSLTLHLNEEVPEDTGYESDEDVSEPTDTDDYKEFDSLLVKNYKLSEVQLNRLGAFLWGNNDIVDQLKKITQTVLDCILNLKLIPHNANVVGTRDLKIGNITPENLTCEEISRCDKVDVGIIAIPTKFGDFMDFPPYTQIYLYLPFLGNVDISSFRLCGKKIKLTYSIDNVTGDLIYTLYQNVGGYYNQISMWSVNVGIDIPLSAINQSMLYSGILSGAMSGSLKNLATNTVYNALTSNIEVSTIGKNSSSATSLTSNIAFITIYTSNRNIPSTFGKDFGFCCNLTKKIGSLKGFTICENPKLNGVPCLESEKEELYRILTTGFYAT